MHGLPPKQGLYDPRHEHDACGVGFVVDVKGRKSNDLVRKGIQVLLNLRHRGACGCEVNTGDGAGVLLQMPHRFLEQECDRSSIDLPAFGEYGVGMVFLPQARQAREHCEALFEHAVRAQGQVLLGWRTVPTDGGPLGATAKSAQPAVRQIFIGRSPGVPDTMAFERRLYVIRKIVENAVKASTIPGKEAFYVSSLSHKTIVYKGMLTADQLTTFYPDLE